MPKNSRNAPKRQTRIFYRNLQCFEPSQGRCEQSLYRAQGHFCWYLRCFLRFLAAHNGPFLGQNGPANLKFGTAPPPPDPPPQTIYANNSQRYCAFRHQHQISPNQIKVILARNFISWIPSFFSITQTFVELRGLGSRCI